MEPASARHPEPGSCRELLSIAIPLIISSGSLSLMMVCDRMFLTWYSTDALAAAMPAGLLHWTLMSIAIGTATYVNTFVAQYEGARQPGRVADSMWQGFYFAVCAGVCIAAVFSFQADALFRFVGHVPAVQAMEASYFRILCLGSPVFLLGPTLACFYSGRGKTATIMYVNMVITVINVALDYWFIFGGLGLAAQGIHGAAWATVIGQATGVTIYVYLLATGADPRRYRLFAHWRFDRELFGRLIRYGLPSGVHFFVDVSCFAVFIVLVGRLGRDALAATNLAFNINSMVFIPMLGFGIAVSTIVGRRIGEGRPELAVRSAWLAAGMSAVYMGGFSILVVAVPDIPLAPFAAGSDPQQFAAIRDTVVVLLRFVAAFAVFDAANIVFAAAIRGAGDTRFCLWFTLVTASLLLVLPTYAAVVWFEAGLFVVWTPVVVYIIVLAVGFLLRFQGGRWKTMRVIEVVPESSTLEPVVTGGAAVSAAPSMRELD